MKCRVCRLRASFDPDWTIAAATEPKRMRCTAHVNESARRPQQLTLPRVWVGTQRFQGAGFFWWLRNKEFRVPFKTFSVPQARSESKLSFVITQRPISSTEATDLGLHALDDVTIKITDDGSLKAVDPKGLLGLAHAALGVDSSSSSASEGARPKKRSSDETSTSGSDADEPSHKRSRPSPSSPAQK